MDTEQMIRECRRLANKHSSDRVNTCQTNYALAFTDIANKLEEQQKTIADLEYKNDQLQKNLDCAYNEIDAYKEAEVIDELINDGITN